MDLQQKHLYINRELSAISFNKRVLEQAMDKGVPLLSRLMFLSIVSSNLDEFFEVRVAGVKERSLLDLPVRGSDAMHPKELLKQIAKEVHHLIDEQYKVLNEKLLPELAHEGIHLLRRTHLTKAQRKWVRNYFIEQVEPVLTPLGLDPAHPFPNVQNKSLNFIVTLSGSDAFGREGGVAILPVPRSLPRLVTLPSESGEKQFMMISSVIHYSIDEMFPGMTVSGCYQFRVTRNSDLWVDEEEVEDLLSALKGELHGRHYGEAVRLEVADNCPKEIIDYLLGVYELQESELYQVNGPVNLHRLGELIGLSGRPDLLYPTFIGGTIENFDDTNIFHTLQKGDILLHHPYQSFDPVVRFIWQAADDPDVLAIKMTLYRVGTRSPIVDALMAAARKNKDVTVIVELRARFDEEANIGLAQKLSEAGAKVAYGVVNYKCHAKILMLVRREQSKLVRYCHIGTGNYHIKNAKLYTDYSLLTSNQDIGEDIHNLFMELTGFGKLIEFKYLLHSPFTLFPSILSLIEQEIEAAQNGTDAWIVAKMNSLTEENMIQALYRASQAGVKITLIVRGICALRPKIEGISENITVLSIVGRLLEHPRVYCFCNRGDEHVYISSADWMDRNLHRRIEAALPILEDKLKERILYEVTNLQTQDHEQTWELQTNGTYFRRVKRGDISPQDKLLQSFAKI